MSAEFVIAIQYLAIAILFFELCFALNQKASDMQKYIILLAVSTILMFVGYIIEMGAKSLESAMDGTTFAYLGKPFVMLFSFLFLCECNGFKVKKWAIACFSVLCTFFPIIVFTNEYHYLYYSITSFDETLKYSPLVTKPGPLYYLYVISAVAFFMESIVIILKGYKRNRTKRGKTLATYSVLMILSGLLGYATYLSGITNGYDSTMAGIFFAGIFLFIIFLRCKVFDLVDFAKDYALGDSSIGLVICDQNDRVVYRNEIVKKLKEDGITLSYVQGLGNEFTTYITPNKERVYSIHKKKLYDNEDYAGLSIEITAITYSYNYQSKLEEEVKARTAELNNIRRELIGSVANIVEARSVETGEHIKRTSYYVDIIAKELKKMGEYTDILTDDYIDMISHAAPLHDIGKISVSDTILLKPGKLTDKEFEKMKVHAKVGADIIESTMSGLESEEYVEIAKEIALYHHERWDGTGYPMGLKGEDIPLCARIMAVADCYDAIVSERCYKRPFPKDEAHKIIEDESGTHFEPIVVEAFIKAIENTEY